jgi:hypothetical protein
VLPSTIAMRIMAGSFPEILLPTISTTNRTA